MTLQLNVLVKNVQIRKLHVEHCNATPWLFHMYYQVVSNIEGTYCTVMPNARGFPTSVVPAWVGLIQLVTVMFVPAHVQNWHTKWTLTCWNDTFINEIYHIKYPINSFVLNFGHSQNGSVHFTVLMLSGVLAPGNTK